MSFEEIIEFVGNGVDAAGVAVIVVGILIITAIYAPRLRGQQAREEYRQGLEVELEGRWPWQRQQTPVDPPAGRSTRRRRTWPNRSRAVRRSVGVCPLIVGFESSRGEVASRSS